MDDLKALRDEMVLQHAACHGDCHGWCDMAKDWAARLTSIIERNEKERAFTEAAKAVFVAEDQWGLEDMRTAEAFEAASISYRALTERGSNG